MASDPGGLLVNHVTYAYDSSPVVRDVSFRLAPADSVALAGPNGSGKTTLLKLLSGVKRPHSGQVSLDGEPLDGLSRRHIASRVAVVAQHLDPNLLFSVERLVSLGRTPHSTLLAGSTDGDRQAVERALLATGTMSLAGRRFKELSGGEQQRVMLAMALAQETDYLLLDEPTVHLDLHHQHELLELLSDLHSTRQVGILAVMHDLNLATLYFQRMGLMHQGRLVAEGPAAEVVARRESLAPFQTPLAVVTHPQTGVPQVLLERKIR